MEKYCSPVAMEVHGGAVSHLQPVQDSMHKQIDAPEESCYSMERKEPMLKQVFWQDL